jgi:hypothetical protein
MSEEPESLSLDELQAFRTSLEDKAATLRQTLHDLRHTKRTGWQAEFERVQAELIAVVTKAGQITRRLRALVKGSSVTEEDDDV